MWARTRGRATHFRPGYLKIPQDDVVECVRVLFSLALSQLTARGEREAVGDGSMPPEAGNLRLLRHLRRLRSRLVPSPAPAPAASTTQERVKAAGSFAACGRTVRCAVCASAQAALMRAGSSRQRRASRRSARWRRVLASLKLAAVIKLAALGSVQHTCARRFACGPRCCAQPEPFCIIFRHLALSRCDELRGSDVVEATLERALRRAQSRPQRGQRKRTAFVCCAHRPTARRRNREGKEKRAPLATVRWEGSRRSAWVQAAHPVNCPHLSNDNADRCGEHVRRAGGPRRSGVPQLMVRATCRPYREPYFGTRSQGAAPGGRRPDPRAALYLKRPHRPAPFANAVRAAEAGDLEAQKLDPKGCVKAALLAMPR